MVLRLPWLAFRCSVSALGGSHEEGNLVAEAHRRESHLSRARKILLTSYGLLLAFCCTWVPWTISFSTRDRAVPPGRYFVGYGFLWSPPSPSPSRLREHVPWLANLDAPFDPTSEVRRRLPEFQDIPEDSILDALAEPNTFRSVFPEYARFDDETIYAMLAYGKKPSVGLLVLMRGVPAIDTTRIALEITALTALFGVLYLLFPERLRPSRLAEKLPEDGVETAAPYVSAPRVLPPTGNAAEQCTAPGEQQGVEQTNPSARPRD